MEDFTGITGRFHRNTQEQQNFASVKKKLKKKTNSGYTQALLASEILFREFYDEFKIKIRYLRGYCFQQVLVPDRKNAGKYKLFSTPKLGEIELSENKKINFSKDNSFYDLLLFCAPEIVKQTKPNKIKDYFKDFEIELKVGVISSQLRDDGPAGNGNRDYSGTIKWKIEPSVTSFYSNEQQPEKRYLLTIGDVGASILLPSKSFAKELAQFTKIWSAPTLKTILITAPPGSGKEFIVSFLIESLSRKKNALSIAGLSADELRIRLCGDEGTEGMLKCNGHEAIFIDEYDSLVNEPEGQAKAAFLLRILEAGEYFCPLTKRIEKIQDLVFVFAGSRKVSSNDGKLNDLKTRIQFDLEFRHPLSDENSKFSYASLKEFFHYFWHNNKERALKTINGNFFLQSVIDKSTKKIDKYSEELEKVLQTKMSRCHFGKRRIDSISVRKMRSLIERLWTHCFEETIKSRESFNNKLSDQEKNKIEKLVDEYLR